MNKKLIRLTEVDLHRIVRESVNKVLREGLPFGRNTPYELHGNYYEEDGDIDEEEVPASVGDFHVNFKGYGYKEVIYTSSVSGNSWKVTTDAMWLVDDALNTDDPKQEDLDALKMLCLERGRRITWKQ